jgi:Domain of unknown function (DUF1707)
VLSWEAPVTTDQGNEIAAAAGGYGQLRASHADRDEAVDLLKGAFVQGRLTRDELDARVSQALTSKTCAQLEALTTDLTAAPVKPAPLPLPRSKPVQAQTRPKSKKAVKSATGAVIAAGVAAVTVLAAMGAHLRPSPDVVACQTFYLWEQPASGGANAMMLLDFSVAAASQGSNPTLTSDLQALQQAVGQYENPIGPLPSVSTLQVNHDHIDATVARINAACVPYDNSN